MRILKITLPVVGLPKQLGEVRSGLHPVVNASSGTAHHLAGVWISDGGIGE
jgi:hypothetical protein